MIYRAMTENTVTCHQYHLHKGDYVFGNIGSFVHLIATLLKL